MLLFVIVIVAVCLYFLNEKKMIIKRFFSTFCISSLWLLHSELAAKLTSVFNHFNHCFLQTTPTKSVSMDIFTNGKKLKMVKDAQPHPWGLLGCWKKRNPGDEVIRYNFYVYSQSSIKQPPLLSGQFPKGGYSIGV